MSNSETLAGKKGRVSPSRGYECTVGEKEGKGDQHRDIYRSSTSKENGNKCEKKDKQNTCRTSKRPGEPRRLPRDQPVGCKLSKLKCIYANVDTLLNKRDEFKSIITLYKPQIIGITEVKPKNLRYNVEVAEVKLDGFDIFHNLHENDRGVCLYICKSLKAEAYTSCYVSSFKEAVFAAVDFQEGGKLLVGLFFYRSPNADNSVNDGLCALFQEVGRSTFQDVLLIGDFNFPDHRLGIRILCKGCRASSSYISGEH